MPVQKPFLKWVGGKTQIMDEILAKVPGEMVNYHEPFLGGGSVLLAILSLRKERQIKIHGKIYACDVNPCLINVYQHIQDKKDTLFQEIARHLEVYSSIVGDTVNRKPRSIAEARTSKESYYYWMRARYNKLESGSVEKSALFMLLNKTCFRGMYREGPNGYNVPYGHYKRTPTIITEEELNSVSDLIRDVEFKCCDFAEAMNEVRAGDFVYLDPPYAPEKATSFVGYVANGFGMDSHHRLFDAAKNLTEAKFLMSNAKVELVMSAFSGCDIQEITARRAINAKKPGSTTTEVLIYN